MFKLVNQERAKEGLPALKLDATLCQAAQKRAKEIKTKFDHTRPDGTGCFTVFKEFGISYMAAGENIAAGQTTPKQVMNGSFRIYLLSVFSSKTKSVVQMRSTYNILQIRQEIKLCQIFFRKYTISASCLPPS